MEEFLLFNFIEITLLYGWSPLNLLCFCRTPFLQKIYGGLLLDIYTVRRNIFILRIFSLVLMIIKISISISFFVSHTKVSKIYFYICPHFLFCPSLYILINHFRSYTKILTMIPLISNPNSPHSYPDSPHSHLYFPHSHPDSAHSHLPHSGFYR